MTTARRSRLLAVVATALVLPSVIAWGVRSVVPGGDPPQIRAAGPAPDAADEAAATSPGASSATAQASAEVEGPAAPAEQAQLLPSAVRPEAPTAVTIPGGVRVRVVPARTQSDGTLAIPDDLRVAGWWPGGARVGDPYGSMLVAAHVDAVDRGLGPFVKLLTVRQGARFTVSSRKLTQSFQVTERRVISRDRLARSPWVSAYSGAHRLTLVTCAPPYIKAEGGYQNLAVVIARPVGSPAQR